MEGLVESWGLGRGGQTFERVSGSTSHIALLAIVEDQSVDVFVVYICDPRSVAVAVKPNQTPLTKRTIQLQNRGIQRMQETTVVVVVAVVVAKGVL